MTIETRQTHLSVEGPLRAFVEKHVTGKLRRHLDRVGRVTVRVDDVNGPRGGAYDKVCRIHAELDHTRSIDVESASDDVYEAVRNATQRLGSAVDRRLGRLRALAR